MNKITEQAQTVQQQDGIYKDIIITTVLEDDDLKISSEERPAEFEH